MLSQCALVQKTGVLLKVTRMFSTILRLILWGGLLYIVLPLDHAKIEQKASETAQQLSVEAQRLCRENPNKCLDGAGKAAEALDKIGGAIKP